VDPRPERQVGVRRSIEDDFVRTIRGLGKTPVQRDTLYREVRVF